MTHFPIQGGHHPGGRAVALSLETIKPARAERRVRDCWREREKWARLQRAPVIHWGWGDSFVEGPILEAPEGVAASGVRPRCLRGLRGTRL